MSVISFVDNVLIMSSNFNVVILFVALPITGCKKRRMLRRRTRRGVNRIIANTKDVHQVAYVG